MGFHQKTSSVVRARQLFYLRQPLTTPCLSRYKSIIQGCYIPLLEAYRFRLKKELLEYHCPYGTLRYQLRYIQFSMIVRRSFLHYVLRKV